MLSSIQKIIAIVPKKKLKKILMLKRKIKRKRIKIPTLIIAKTKILILKKMALKNQMIMITMSQVMLLIIAKIVTLMIMAILIIIIKANHLATIITAQINKTTQAQISIHLILIHQKLMLQKKMIYQILEMSTYLSRAK